MNNLMMHLASQPQIKYLYTVIGADTSPWFVTDICKALHLDELTVSCAYPKQEKEIRECMSICASDPKFHSPSKLAFETKENLRPFFPREKTHTALLVEGIQDRQVLRELARVEPNQLIVAIATADVDAFAIWETYRTVCEKIYIVSWVEGCQPRVMDWSRSPENDVELSVIFPMYKIADYLPKCIETTTAWKANYVEFLFVDDGSPDNCADIVREYAKKDSRIKLLQKKNGGCASARQYGLERAVGRYIGFIDPDDYIDETMFSKLLEKALVGNYEISYSGYNEYYEALGETREIPDLINNSFEEGTSNSEDLLDLVTYLRVAIWRGIYKRELLERNNIHFYTDLPRFDDLPFKFEVFACAKSVVSVPEYLYYYRMARPGQDIAANDERLYVHKKIFEYLDIFAQKKDSEKLYHSLQVVKLNTHIYALCKLKDEYIREYLKLAKVDLSHNLSKSKTRYILKRTVPRSHRLFYWSIQMESVWMVKTLCKYSIRKNGKHSKILQRQIDKIENFNTLQ